MSTTSGCWVRRRAPGSCSMRRCVPWRSEGLRERGGGGVFLWVWTSMLQFYWTGVVGCHSPFEQIKVVKFNGAAKRIFRIFSLLLEHFVRSWNRSLRVGQQCVNHSKTSAWSKLHRAPFCPALCGPCPLRRRILVALSLELVGFFLVCLRTFVKATFRCCSGVIRWKCLGRRYI